VADEIADVITRVKFLVDGSEVTEFGHPQFSHSPLTWLVALTAVKAYTIRAASTSKLMYYGNLLDFDDHAHNGFN